MLRSKTGFLIAFVCAGIIALGAFIFYPATPHVDQTSAPAPESVKETRTDAGMQAMRDRIFPDLKQSCLVAFTKREHWTTFVATNSEDYCNCYARGILAAMTSDEIDYQEKNKSPSATYESAVQRIAVTCMNKD